MKCLLILAVFFPLTLAVPSEARRQDKHNKVHDNHGHHGYVSLTTDIGSVPYLGQLPFTLGEVITLDLSPHIPPDTTEVLVYVFLSMFNSDGDESRGFYHIYTEDENGEKYGQMMNIIFTNNDTVASSDNLILPIFDKQEVKVEIPMLFPVSQEVVDHPRPNFRNLADGMRAYVSAGEGQGGTMYADAYLLGFKD